MNVRLTFFLFIFCILPGLPGQAQLSGTIFSTVPVINKSSVGLITAITQDHNGYLWLATETGLHRFDGYHQESFTPVPGEENSLGGMFTECVAADSDGMIWIGTTLKGLDRYDPQTGKFTHFRTNPKDPGTLSSDVINTILVDHNNNLWVGTRNGLNYYDRRTGKFTRFIHDENDSTSLSQNEVRVVYEDRKGTIWVGTGSPWGWNLGGLNRYNAAKGCFTSWLHNPKDTNSLADNRVLAILEDSHGNFWVGTAGDGLHIMDRERGIFHRQSYDSARPQKLSRPALKGRFMDAEDHITFIKEDASGVIWIGSFRNGLTRFDPVSNSLSRYGTTQESASGYNSQTCWSAFTSHDGLLWISTWDEKIFIFNPYRRDVPHFTVQYPVTAIQADTSGKLWLGTPHGIYRADSAGGPITNYLHHAKDPGSLVSDQVVALYSDPGSGIWVGTGHGISSFYPPSTSFTSILHDQADSNSLTDEMASAFCRKDVNHLWVGTQRGLDLMNTQTRIFTHYWSEPHPLQIMSDDWITCLLKKGSDTLWTGCEDGGLWLMNTRTQTKKQYLATFTITCLYEEASGQLWAGTKAGLYFFDAKHDKFTRFEFGEPGGEKIFIGYLMEDEKKNLWLGSSRGIVRISPKRDSSYFFGENNGVSPVSLRSHGYILSCYKDHDGKLLFPDFTGYYYFSPGAFAACSVAPQIVVNSFWQYNAPADSGGDTRRRLPNANQLNLTYDQNSLEFDFTAIHYTHPEENTTVFMLENSDKGWRQGAGDQVAYYNHLEPGMYTLHIRALNEEGIWSEKNIRILVSPPWWRLWWAEGLLILVILALIFWLYRWRVLSLKNMQRGQINTMIATQENERKRISRDLHDDIGTKLSALKLFISALQSNLDNNNVDGAKLLAGHTEEMINETVKDVREMLVDLSPKILEDFGYTTAIETLISRINITKLVHVDLILFGMERGPLSPGLELTLYRITQELINNVLKHADAKNVSLQVGYRDQKIVLMIEDDGNGFDFAMHRQGYGLKNLAARTSLLQGTVSIDSSPGKGTSVLIEIPFQFNSQDHVYTYH